MERVRGRQRREQNDKPDQEKKRKPTAAEKRKRKRIIILVAIAVVVVVALVIIWYVIFERGRVSTATVGVAEAQRFPSLSLRAGTSLVSTQLSQLVHHDSWTWNAGGSLTAPICEGGRLAAIQRAAEAAATQSTLQYRQTALQAFREAEDALQNYAAARDQLAAIQMASQAQHVALERATQSIGRD